MAAEGFMPMPDFSSSNEEKFLPMPKFDTVNPDAPSAQDIAMASDKPVTPSKYNLGETLSPRQILELEAQGINTTQRSSGEWKPDGGIGMVQDPNKPDFNPNPYEQKNTPTEGFQPMPSFDQNSGGFMPMPDSEADYTVEVNPLQSFGQGIASSFGSLGRLAAHVPSALLAQAGFTNLADAGFEYGDRVKKLADELVLSGQDQEHQTFGAKVVQGIGGAIPYLLAPEAAVPAMAATHTMDTGEGLISQGANLTDSQLSAVAAGTAATAMGAISTFSPSMAKAVLYTAGSNFVLGGTEDAMIHGILLNNSPQLAASYDWKNPERRALDLATGVAFGIGMNIHGNVKIEQAKKQLEADMKARVGALTDSVKSLIEQGMPNVEYPQPREGETHNQAQDRVYREGGTAQEVLGLMAKNDKIQPAARELANTLFLMSHELGLDMTRVLDNGTLAGGEYDSTEDVVHKQSDQTHGQGQAGNYLSLHEIEHAVSYAAVHYFLTNEKNGAAIAAMTPKQKAVFDAVANINRIYERAQDIAAGITKQQRNTPEFASWDSPQREQALSKIHLKIDDITQRMRDGEVLSESDLEYFSKHYGLGHRSGQNGLHEFISETLTNPEFQKHLNSMRDVDGFGDLRQTSDSKLRSLWQAFKQAVLKLHGASSTENSLLPIALDHVFNLHDNMNAEMRFSPNALPGKAYMGKLRTESLERLAGTVKGRADPASTYILQQLAFIRENSNSKAEFFQRAANELPEENWYQFLRENGDRLYANPHQLIALAKEHAQYGREEAAWTRYGPDMEANLKKIFENFGLNITKYIDGNRVVARLSAKDLTKLGQHFYSKDVQDIKNKGDIAGAIVQLMHDRAEYYRTMEAVTYERAKEHMSAYNELPYKAKASIMNTVIRQQSRRFRKQYLEDTGQRWLSEQQLRDLGHTPEEIAAYMGIARATEYLFSTLNAAEIKRGNQPIPFVPGFMPHVWRGPFKVFIALKNVNPRDPNYNKERIVEVQDFDTKWQAKRYLKKLAQKRDSVRDHVMYAVTDPKTGEQFKSLSIRDQTQTLAANIAEKTQSYYNQFQFPETVHEVLDGLESDAQMGITTHAMERSDVRGWLGQQGIKRTAGDVIGLHSKDNRNTILLYQNYAKAVAKYSAGVAFTKEVTERLLNDNPVIDDGKMHYGQLFAEMPELRKYIAEYGYTFTGQNINHLNMLDGYITDFWKDTLGRDPREPKYIIRGLKNALSTLFLKINPGNYAANFLQPVNAVPMLYLAHATLGYKPGVLSPIEAFTKGLLAHISPNKDQQAALDWARMQHISDPQIAAEISRSGKIAKEPNNANPWNWNNAIEGQGRERVFMMAYEFYKTVFPGDVHAARQAAARFMGLVQVNYDKSQRPMMFSNLGLAGEYMSPFAVYRNAMIGNMALITKHVMNNPTSLAAWKPVAAFMVVSTMLGGLVGLPLVKEYDSFAHWVNTMFGWNWPTFTSLVHEAKVPDAIAFGSLSDLTGVNLSPSMSSVSGDGVLNSALTDFIDGLKDLAVGGAKNAISAAYPNQNYVLPASSDDFYAALNKVSPGIAKPYIRDMFRDTTRDVIPSSSNLQGSTYETPEESFKSHIWGKQPLDEARRTYAIREDKTQQKIQNQQYSELVQRIADDRMGLKLNNRSLEMEYALAWQLNNSSVEKVINDVQQVIMDRIETQPQKWLKSGVNPDTVRRLQQYHEITQGRATK